MPNPRLLALALVFFTAGTLTGGGLVASAAQAEPLPSTWTVPGHVVEFIGCGSACSDHE